MPRDLDGYTLPNEDGGPGRRRTTWSPEGFELQRVASGGVCRCPCRIAHPEYLVDACEEGVRVAAVSVGRVGMGEVILPLCGVCAAAQLHDRWGKALRERGGWRVACGGFGSLAVVLAIVGTLVGAPIGYPAVGLLLALALASRLLTWGMSVSAMTGKLPVGSNGR